MRFLKLSISSVILGLLLSGSVFASSVDDFSFSDFTADYYLYKDEEGISRLKVVENLTAEFPSYNQNKGICREIPFTNQDKKNVTLKELNKQNLKLLRNGESEPIYSIDKYGDFFRVCTGDETYVRNTQVYTFEYEFEKTITEWAKYQELYWDTNGNGWSQSFGSVTARVHLSSDVYEGLDKGKWCYVGKYGSNDQDRCEITEIEDGYQFVAKNLAPGENLTFDVQIKLGTFVVPPADKNYTLVYIMVGVIVVCVLLLIIPFRKFIKVGEKRRFYKGFFVKPEFQPHKQYTVGELAEIYIGDKKDSKVAVLLDMIVKKQVKLIKNEESKKKSWSLLVEKKDEISDEGDDILKILNGGNSYEDGDVIVIKKQTPSEKLARIGRHYNKGIIGKLKSYGLAESRYSEYTSSGGNIILQIIGFLFAFWYFIPFVIVIGIDIFGPLTGESLIGDVVAKDICAPVVICTVIITIIIYAMLRSNTTKYLARTKKGLEMSRFMDGAKLYIKMAEAERMELLQSVTGVDTSPKGIVNLYEKLLPYAAVFGLEKSWMAEMEEYCRVEDVEEPEWIGNGFDSYTMHSVISSATRYANSSTSYGSSSISGGGGSSSSFSGGGGGGFSGGGGGGGGGGGR